jgi:hypothetical protein
MQPVKNIVIELSEKDAESFREFRRFQTNFNALQDCGFFTIRNGSAIVHFDQDGVVRKVESHQVIMKA